MSDLPTEVFLDGEWEFAYTRDVALRKDPAAPTDSEFETSMPVPGYWDDHIDRLNTTVFWSRDVAFNKRYRSICYPMGSGKPVDASLPFIQGVGWYRRVIDIPENWRGCLVTLRVGGVVEEAWVCIDGRLLHQHAAHLTPFEVRLDRSLRWGAPNELMIAVANLREGVSSCVTRGYKGKTAGIYRSVALRVVERTRIEDVYVYVTDSEKLRWSVDLDGDLSQESLSIHWAIRDADGVAKCPFGKRA